MKRFLVFATVRDTRDAKKKKSANGYNPSHFGRDENNDVNDDESDTILCDSSRVTMMP